MDKAKAIKMERSFLKSDNFILVAILIGIIVFFTTQSGVFLTPANGVNVLTQVTEIGMISIGMTFVLISGGMDLSVGSVVGISGAVLGLTFNAGLNIWLCVLIVLGVGLLCGCLNGVLIAKLNNMPIFVSLGTMIFLRGMIFALTEGRPVSGFPKEFFFLGQGTIGPVPFNVIVLALMFFGGYFLLRHTWIGRYAYGMGNNDGAMRYTGINVASFRFKTYLVNSFIASLASVFMVSRLASAEANMGYNMELDVLAAVLLGGTDIFGGKGNMIGTILGVMVIRVLRNGLNLMGVPSLYQIVILGILIIVAVGRQRHVSE